MYKIMPLFSACLDGFIGEECDKSCSYPSYGRNCRFICNCTEKYCNASTGCVQGMPLNNLNANNLRKYLRLLGRFIDSQYTLIEERRRLKVAIPFSKLWNDITTCDMSSLGSYLFVYVRYIIDAGMQRCSDQE